MERMDILIKSGVGIATGMVSWIVGSFGIAFSVLLALLALDFITGVMVAVYTKKLSSNIGVKGLIKKTYIILLLLAVYLIELSILHTNGVVASGISGAFALMEFVSIIENGGKMGVKLPSGIQKMVSMLKNKTGENTSSNEDKKDE